MKKEEGSANSRNQSTSKKKLKESKNIHTSRGISIQGLIVIFCSIICVFFAGIIAISYLMPDINQNLTDYNGRLNDIEAAASELKDARIYKAARARLFVSSGDALLIEEYYEHIDKSSVLASSVDLLPPMGEDEKLDDLVAKIEAVDKKLNQTEAYSIYIAAGVFGVDTAGYGFLQGQTIANEDQGLDNAALLEKAGEYLFSEDYRRDYQSFDELVTELRRTASDFYDGVLAQNTAKLSKLMVIQRIFVLALTIVIITMFVVLSVAFIRPIKGYIKNIDDNVAFTTGGVRELRGLVTSYNRRYETNTENTKNLVTMTETDSLTGLINQRAFSLLKKQLFGKNEPMAVVVIDLDRFKQINDEFGHDKGDKALMVVAEELKKIISGGSHAIRLGGDEFVVVLTAPPENYVEEITKSYLLLKERISAKQTDIRVSLSVGVSYSKTGYSDQLFHEADMAMYQVKRRGGNGIHFYDAEDTEANNGSAYANGKKGKILLCEDFRKNIEGLEGVLSKEYRVIVAETPQRAMDRIEKRGHTYQAVFIDLSMPNDAGFKIIDYIIKYNWQESFPVIAVTTEKNSAIETAFSMGVTDYVCPPFYEDVLLKKTANAISIFLSKRKFDGIVFSEIQANYEKYDKIFRIFTHMLEYHSGEKSWRMKQVDTVTDLLIQDLKNQQTAYSISDEEAWCITKASVLHDIGKFAIPDAIINKPDKLTDEEYDMIKTHCKEGAEIIKRLGDIEGDRFLRIAHEVCLYHHERFDGNGYPFGLKGDDIPISAQIVSVADVYDALISERCYSKAFSHEKALEIIFNGECGSFNPVLLKSLSNIAPKLKNTINFDAEE